MTKNKVYSLCEAVADISYIAATENYYTNDSREMISQFIEWADIRFRGRLRRRRKG